MQALEWYCFFITRLNTVLRGLDPNGNDVSFVAANDPHGVIATGWLRASHIKASEVFCFYGDGIQIADVSSEYERLKQEQEVFLHEKSRKKVGAKEKTAFPPIPKFHLPGKATAQKVIEPTDQEAET